MPLENSPHADDQERKTHSELYQYAEERFNDGYKLDHDTMNIWSTLGYVTSEIPGIIEKIKPREHYGEYVAKIDQRWGENGVYAEMIMRRSDPESVAAFGRLVDEFNADLERIIREKDFATPLLFLQRAKELIYAKFAS